MQDAYDEINAMSERGAEEGAIIEIESGGEVWSSGREVAGVYQIGGLREGNFGAYYDLEPYERSAPRRESSVPADQILKALRRGHAHVLKEGHGFDKFMDAIVEREERGNKRVRKLQEQEDNWGRKRDIREREHAPNRIRYGTK